MKADPSEGNFNSCNIQCHGPAPSQHRRSLHTTQQGYMALIEARSGIDLQTHPGAQEGFARDCASCHASCGDCHVSQPKNVGGGLVSAHRVRKTPDMNRQCTACHGSRVGDEYRGLNEYAGADVHWVPYGMTCTGCHTSDEMHGDRNADPQYRYEVASMPACEDCHEGLEVSNEWHEQHFDDMSCQVCHSQTYKSCNGCHVGVGITGSSYPTFKIGRNPIPTLRSKPYVLLRHIPIAADTYAGWGIDDLPSYASKPTWKYATPHNIRLRTARTDTTGGRSCDEACHDSEDSPSGYFLRASDLAGLPLVEQQANQALTVPAGDPTGW